MDNRTLEPGFWEYAHANYDRLWVSSWPLKEVWTNLGIIDKLVDGINVLNIGVGLIGVGGYGETLELSRHNVNIDVLDISQTALDRAKYITENRFLSTDISNLPIEKYDIVVSHETTQHITDDQLNDQLQYVIRSLKPLGIFAMHYVELDTELNVTQPILPEENLLFFRTPVQMQAMVEAKGGHISWSSDVKTFVPSPEYPGSVWWNSSSVKFHYIQITK